MERLLVEALAQEYNFTIIDKLQNSVKTQLKEHIQHTILEKSYILEQVKAHNLGLLGI